jgi:hypothetical protein
LEQYYGGAWHGGVATAPRALRAHGETGLTTIRCLILHAYVQSCVASAARSGAHDQQDAKIAEPVDVIGRLGR